MKIETDVRRWILENTRPEVRELSFSDTDSLIGVGALDSLAIMNLVNWLEERYSFRIAEDDFDIRNFETISLIAAFIRKVTPATAGAT